MEIPPCGLSGDPQSLGSLFLFKAFEIDQTDKFDLLRFERDPFVFLTKAAAGLVASRLPNPADNTSDARPSPSGAF